uniref:Uncharacterized protein n=1 Tax=Leifsonia xyli subsp. cynodontis TaxID=31966 RepID=Q6XGD2_LEIXC|nr:unknown [Leifsonia xyli subsp. cynodontis]
MKAQYAEQAHRRPSTASTKMTQSSGMPSRYYTSA